MNEKNIANAIIRSLLGILEKRPVVRNALRIMQSMYNFLEESTIHHNIFQEFDGNQGKNYLLLSLKFQGIW